MLFSSLDGEKELTNTQIVVLPADEDGGQEVPGNEEQEKDVVRLVVVVRVEDGEEDEAGGADDGEDDADDGEDFFLDGGVGHEAAVVPQPALGGKGQVEEDGGDGGAGDEEGLELAGANVADEGDLVVAAHPRVVRGVCVDDPVEEQAEEHAAPDEAGDDGEDLGGEEKRKG